MKTDHSQEPHHVEEWQSLGGVAAALVGGIERRRRGIAGEEAGDDGKKDAPAARDAADRRELAAPGGK